MAYERIGIVKPGRRSNRRVYTDDEIQWVGCAQDLNRRGGISLHGLAALLRFVPCWAVRSAAGSRGPKESGLPEFPAGPCLERVHRAYDGEAPEPCVSCGVFLKNRNASRIALERTVLEEGSVRGEPRT
jgi:MerR family transcriptional regulator/heat shock protein HspR